MSNFTAYLVRISYFHKIIISCFVGFREEIRVNQRMNRYFD